MQKPKLDVLVAMLAYGGNGGVATVLPNHATWLASTSVKAAKDERIGRFDVRFYGDVPLSMERNRIVRDAMDGGYDAILMIDSDNEIDGYVGAERDAKPFWDSSIGFLYERELRGLPTVVCAPYCGPPPHPVNGGAENVYVFYVDDFETLDPGQPNGGWKIVPYSRQYAATMRGIQPIAAGPTGVILYSTSAFRVLPESVAPEEVLEKYRKGELHLERAKQLLDRKSWFYYEYTDAARSRKASTEDVTSTREIQLAGCIKHGEPIVFCNWDSWAMHLKPKRVGKPNVLPIEAVSQAFQEVVRDNVSVDDNRVMLDLPDLPEHDPTLGGRLHLVKKNGHDFMHVGFVSNQDDLAVIEGLIQKLDMPVPVGVEIGSWVGDSATTIANTHKDLWMTCVDTFKGSGSDQTHLLFKDLVKTTGDDDILFNTFCDNVESYKGRIAPYRATSAEAAEVFEDFSLDFAYIDAGHNYEECLEDIKLWLPKIKAGGLIFGHDHCEHFPGVIKACKEMFGDDYDVEGTVWWYWVPEGLGPHVEESANEDADQPSALDEANEVVILGRKFVDPVIAPEEAATINALCDVDEFATVLAVSERAEIAWAALSGREGKAAFWATSNAASAVALALAPGRTLQCSLLKSLERIEAAVLVIDTESEIPQEALRHVANKGKIVAISKEPLGEPFVHVAGSIYVGKKERVTQSVDD
jgi:hypothetical protein